MQHINYNPLVERLYMSEKIEQALIDIDKWMDRLPVVGTVNNVVDIVQKVALDTLKLVNFFRMIFQISPHQITSHYYRHLDEKSYAMCFTLLIPGAGIAFDIYDLIQKHREDSERKNQDLQAHGLGSEASQSPPNTSESGTIKIINPNPDFSPPNLQAQGLELEVSQPPPNTSESGTINLNPNFSTPTPDSVDTQKMFMDKFYEELPNIIKGLDESIRGAHLLIEDFKKTIDNPTAPLNVTNGCGRPGRFWGTYEQKINHHWSCIKQTYKIPEAVGSLFSPGGLDQHETINEKLQKISELKKQLSELRRTSYRDYLQTIGEEELFKEAKKYYLESCAQENGGSNVTAVLLKQEEMTLNAILPKLEGRVAEAKNDLDVVEMQEIISQIKKA